jgi:hypothetical protein
MTGTLKLMSVELKLKADDATEKRVLAYLTENASDPLIEKINAGGKTIAGSLGYAKGEAQKLAKGAGCICIEDDTVFGWIIHYFEEKSIKEPKKKAKGPRVPGGVKKVEKTKKVEKKPPYDPSKDPDQGSMFEVLFK